MNEAVAKIMNMFGKLNDMEQQLVSEGLAKHFETNIRFTIEELSLLSEEHLDVIGKVLGGMIFTKDNVPNMREAYERLKGTDLPSRVSFGRIEDK